MKKKFLLTSMCLVSLLGLGACGGPNINNKRLKENEKLYVYSNNSSENLNFSVLASYSISSFDNSIIAHITGSFGSEIKHDAIIYYTITSSYVSLEMKDKTSQERQAKYTYTSFDLSYCLIAKE